MFACLVSWVAGLLFVHLLEGKTSGPVVVSVSGILSLIISCVVDVAVLVVNAVVTLPVYVVTRPLFITRLLGVVALALAVHHWQEETLTLCDVFFRKILNPSVHFLYTVVFALRVIYEPAAAFFNYYVAVSKTAIWGSLQLITKCNLQLFLNCVKGLFETIQLLFQSVFRFLGAGNEGTLFTNDWELVDTLTALQTVIVAQREIVDCACEQASSLYKILVSPVDSEYLSRAANHWANIGISLVQDLIRSLPRWGEYPTLRKTFHHSQGFIHNLGLWLDHAVLEATSISLEEIFAQDPIDPLDRPAFFLGSTLANIWQAALELIYVGVRSAIHLLIPLRLSDSDYVFKLLSPREIFDIHLRKAGDSLTNSLHWILEYSWSRMMSKPAPAPQLNCNFSPAFYGDRLFQSFFCAARYALRAATGVLAVGSTLPAEFVVHGVLFQDRNIWHMLQRYQGAFRLNDPHLSSCEMRLASPWDHSTDISLCNCVFEEDIVVEFPPFNREADTWSSLSGGTSASCAQPQLEDAFRDLKDAVHHTSNIISPFAKSFFSTAVNGIINSFSVSLRLVLSAEDILDGEFFQYPLGQAGYGFREDLALAAWEEAGNAIISSQCPDGQIPETALPGSPCTEVSDVVRLHDARTRMYKGAELCRSTNANAGCTCNPALPMQDNSICGCMLTYPDDERVAADSYTQVRFSQNFQSRGWCGSQIFEPILMDLEAESGSAITDLVDGLHPGAGVGWCGKEDYVVLETNMNQFTKREWENDAFLVDRARFTRDELDVRIADLLASKTLAREEAHLPRANAAQLQAMTLASTQKAVLNLQGVRALSHATEACVLDENSGLKIDTEAFDEALVGAPPATRAGCLVDKTVLRSQTLAVWKKNSCTVRGNHDIVCAANAYASRAAQIYIGAARQLWSGIVALLSGYPAQVTWDLSNRLCDLQKSISYQTSILSSLFPVERQTRVAMNKLMFLALEFGVEQFSIQNSGLVLFDSLVKGELFTAQKEDSGPVYEFIENVIGTYLTYGANVLQSAGDLFESFDEGSGEFLYSVEDFITKFKEAVTDSLVKTAVVYVELLGEFVAVASGTTSEIPALVKSIFEFLKTLKLILPSIAMKTLGIVLEMLGPLGSFLSMIAGTVCNILEGIINIIISVVDGLSFGLSGLEHIDMGCLEGFGADINATELLSNKRSINDIPKIIASLGWGGSSYCANVVNSYAEYKLHALKPLEKESIFSCLKQRWLGIKLSEQTGILDLQTVIYDWESRIRAVFRLARASYVYFEGMNVRAAKTFLDEVEMAQYLPAVRGFWSYLTANAPAYLYSSANQIFDASVESMERQGGSSARVARVTKTSKHVVAQFARHWSAHNMTQSGSKFIAAPAQMLTAWWDTNNTKQSPPLQPDAPFDHAEQNLVLARARRKLGVVAKRGYAVSKHALGYSFGAAGVQSNVKPCTENSLVCVNCAIVDNVLSTVVEEGVRVALFLRYTWVEVTLAEAQRSLAKRAVQLQNGFTEGVEGLFSDISQARININMAEAFDNARKSSGAAAKYAAQAALDAAKNAAGNAGGAATSLADYLEFAFESTKEVPGTKSTDALHSLKQRNKAYSLGAEDHPYRIMTYTERQALDWDYLWQNWPDVPFNVTHSRDTPLRADSVPTINILKAFRMYLTKTSGDYVPLFGEPLFYSLSQPLLAKCPMGSVIYSESTTQKERLRRVGRAFWITLLAGGILLGLQFYLNLPILAITFLAPLTMSFLSYLFLWVVYGWGLNCNPSVPVLAAADATAYINDFMHPRPLCERFPGLVADTDACDSQTSISFTGSTQWKECAGDPAYDELGYFYSTVYYLRLLVPGVYNYLRTVQPFRYWLSNFETLDLLDEKNELRENCARLLMLDVGGVLSVLGVGLFLVYNVVAPPVFALAKTSVRLSVQLVGLVNLLVLSVSETE